MDAVSLQRIEKLHPKIRNKVKKILQECDEALTGRAKVRITQGLRTFAEQDALYAQGRTKPGKKVTNAKGGQSIHNYGLAFDICLIIYGKDVSWDTVKDWDGDRKADWMEVVSICKANGFSWGGDWKTSKDLPHFDLNGYGNWKKLRDLKKDSQGYVVI